MDAKSYKCMHLGYSDQAKAYRVLDIASDKVKFSRSLLLDEREVESICTESPTKDAIKVIHWQDERDDDHEASNERTNEDNDVEMTDGDRINNSRHIDAEGADPGEQHDQESPESAALDIPMGNFEHRHELVMQE